MVAYNTHVYLEIVFYILVVLEEDNLETHMGVLYGYFNFFLHYCILYW